MSATTIKFHIVDVFAEAKYEGNQLAVFEHYGNISTELMQKMANETNFTETTFIDMQTIDNEIVDVRIFTKEMEVPFAGHPTLGTAFVLKKLRGKNETDVKLNLKIGVIEVHTIGETLWMQQINPSFRGDYSKTEVADFLGIQASDIADFPIEEVCTGLPFVFVPVKNKAVVEKSRINFDKWENFLKTNQLFKTNSPWGMTSGVFIFTNETSRPENHLHGRMYWHEGGAVMEDSATGSANGCLLGYILKNKYLGEGEVYARVEQGFEIPRPSILELSGKQLSDNRYLIRVGGKVQAVATGEWGISN
jgi:trans-2,3-dihydro-3-hydroxyanthranilate isomerase